MRWRETGGARTNRLPASVEQDLSAPAKAREHVGSTEICAHHVVGRSSIDGARQHVGLGELNRRGLLVQRGQAAGRELAAGLVGGDARLLRRVVRQLVLQRLRVHGRKGVLQRLA